MGCGLRNVSHLHSLGDFNQAKYASSLFFADGILCMVFAFFTHHKYTSVTVLNYSVNTIATSNTRWIWYFIFTSLSSFMNGLNFWINLKESENSQIPFIIGWIAHLLGVLSLAFAIKHQWKYREEAFQNMSSETDNERTPILGREERTGPSVADVFFLGFLLLGFAFFISGLSIDSHKSSVYWIAFGYSWLIRIGILIFIVIIIIHYNSSVEGPSVLVKFLLLLGVLLNTPSDIPSYIWIKCILGDQWVYELVIGAALLSHLAFFVVLRSEFLRLKDITRWHVADHLDHIEGDNSEVVTS